MEQLTIDKLIEFLEKVRKEHGGHVKVCHVEFGGLTESYNVDIDESDKTPIVVISS